VRQVPATQLVSKEKEAKTTAVIKQITERYS